MTEIKKALNEVAKNDYVSFTGFLESVLEKKFSKKLANKVSKYEKHLFTEAKDCGGEVCGESPCVCEEGEKEGEMKTESKDGDSSDDEEEEEEEEATEEEQSEEDSESDEESSDEEEYEEDEDLDDEYSDEEDLDEEDDDEEIVSKKYEEQLEQFRKDVLTESCSLMESEEIEDETSDEDIEEEEMKEAFKQFKSELEENILQIILDGGNVLSEMSIWSIIMKVRKNPAYRYLIGEWKMAYRRWHELEPNLKKLKTIGYVGKKRKHIGLISKNLQRAAKHRRKGVGRKHPRASMTRKLRQAWIKQFVGNTYVNKQLPKKVSLAPKKFVKPKPLKSKSKLVKKDMSEE